MLRGPRPNCTATRPGHDELAGMARQVKEWLPTDGTPVVHRRRGPERRLMTEVETYLTDHGIPATTMGRTARASPTRSTSAPCTGSRALNTSRCSWQASAPASSPPPASPSHRDSRSGALRAGAQAGPLPAVRRGHEGTRLPGDHLARHPQPISAVVSGAALSELQAPASAQACQAPGRRPPRPRK